MRAGQGAPPRGALVNPALSAANLGLDPLSQWIVEVRDGHRRLDPRFVFNPWSANSDDDAHVTGAMERRLRLLEHMAVAPRWLLIGEAPGYQGARVSGLAFTSERLLCQGKIPRMGPSARISTRATPWSEPSASIVWQTLAELGIERETVLWNVFPWHPHNPDEPLSNRTPVHAEVQAGALILQGLMDLFPAAEVLAVGQVAHRAMAESGLPCHGTLRHPAHGGKADFVQGLRAKVTEYQLQHELDALFE